MTTATIRQRLYHLSTKAEIPGPEGLVIVCLSNAYAEGVTLVSTGRIRAC